MPSPLPRRNHSLLFVRFVCDSGLPRSLAGSASASILFEACSAFTHVTACMLAKFLKEPSTPEAPAASLPPRLLQLLPAGAKVAGRDSHPLKDSALARRTLKKGVNQRFLNSTLSDSFSPSRDLRLSCARMPYVVIVKSIHGVANDNVNSNTSIAYLRWSLRHSSTSIRTSRLISIAFKAGLVR